MVKVSASASLCDSQTPEKNLLPVHDEEHVDRPSLKMGDWVGWGRGNGCLIHVCFLSFSRCAGVQGLL